MLSHPSFYAYNFLGSDSCTQLLTKGKWREERGQEKWQPFGCMIHEYHRK